MTARLPRVRTIIAACCVMAASSPAGHAADPPSNDWGFVAECARARELALRPAGTAVTPPEPRPTSGHPILAVIDARPDLRGLPVRREDGCQLPPAEAQQFGERAVALRAAFAELGSIRTDIPDLWQIALRRRLGPHDPEANAGLMLQLLQCEDTNLRRLLINQMRDARGPNSAHALAVRALYEPDAALRREAAAALAGRSSVAFRDELLAGLRHPSPPVADHAAAALVAVRDRWAVGALAKMLDEPDPVAPVAGKDGTPMVRELVRINHARNCQLCHAASASPNDPARAVVPATDQPLPPSFSVAYYSSQSGTAVVRADVTYLRQDYSLMLPVAAPGPWPGMQRFDFFVRERPATATETAAVRPTDYPQRRAVLAALRGITGRDFGESATAWQRYANYDHRP
jgi:hypothetical protein